MSHNTVCNSATPKLRRPIYTQNKDNMKVTYYDGSKWQQTVFDNEDKFNKMAQDITKFISANAFKNHGRISSANMLSAWMRTKSVNLPISKDEMQIVMDAYNSDRVLGTMTKINELDKMIQTACQDNSPGGSDVTQDEQFSIMNALANWFTK